MPVPLAPGSPPPAAPSSPSGRSGGPQRCQPDPCVALGLDAVSFVISCGTAYLAVRFLLTFFENERLDRFGYYCIAFGIVCLAISETDGDAALG